MGTWEQRQKEKYNWVLKMNQSKNQNSLQWRKENHPWVRQKVKYIYIFLENTYSQLSYSLHALENFFLDWHIYKLLGEIAFYDEKVILNVADNDP